MRISIFHAIFYLLFVGVIIAGCGPSNNTQSADDYWLMFEDSISADQGYKDRQGNMVIFPGEYAMCLTDTFYKYALVSTASEMKYVVIDRQENIVYEAFIFDNGPDYVSDGLFRMIKNGKIGYADGRTLEVVIQPQFDCAYPFENGRAKVSKQCTTKEEFEHKTWESEHWEYIDKNGKTL